MKCPLKPADVDAELQRRSGDGGLGLLLVAHELLGSLAVGRRQVAMMDEETVGFVVGFAVGAQAGTHGLCLLARIDENEALASAGVFEDVSKPRVGVLRCGVGWGEEFGRRWGINVHLGLGFMRGGRSLMRQSELSLAAFCVRSGQQLL